MKHSNQPAENTAQEPACISSHEPMYLTTRIQGDGTSYSFCERCRWVDVRNVEALPSDNGSKPAAGADANPMAEGFTKFKLAQSSDTSVKEQLTEILKANVRYYRGLPNLEVRDIAAIDRSNLTAEIKDRLIGSWVKPNLKNPAALDQILALLHQAQTEAAWHEIKSAVYWSQRKSQAEYDEWLNQRLAELESPEESNE